MNDGVICGWALSRLQVLPRNGKPIALWRSRDEAFTQIAQEIHTIILQRHSEDRHQKGYWMRLGYTHLQANQYKQALHAYCQASEMDPNDATLHRRIGEILATLANYDQALTHFELSLTLVPQNAATLRGKANALLHLQRHEEALRCYQLILDHFQATPAALCGKGHALFALRRYQEALAAYEQSATLFPEFAYSHHYKAIVLMYLTQYQEALASSQQAIALNSHESSFYLNASRILEKIGDEQQKEAIILHDLAGDDVMERKYSIDMARHMFDVNHEFGHIDMQLFRDAEKASRQWLKRIIQPENTENLE